MKTRWNDIKKKEEKLHMSSVTLRNRWGSFRWSPGHRGRRRKPPAALPGTPVQLWLLCVVECFLSPVGQENNKNNTMLRRTSSCVHAKKRKGLFVCHSPGGRSWPARPEIRASGRSPSSRSEHWSGVAERRLTSGFTTIITRWCNTLVCGKCYNFERSKRRAINHTVRKCSTQETWNIHVKILKLNSTLNRWPQRQALTLLRSLAVTLSSSRQGIRWTYASIWYLALMNSVLLGLKKRAKRLKIKHIFKAQFSCSCEFRDGETWRRLVLLNHKAPDGHNYNGRMKYFLITELAAFPLQFSRKLKEIFLKCSK